MTRADIEAAFDEHGDAVYRFAWRMSASRTAAEDIAQEVFLSLLKAPERFDPARGSLRTFLMAIAPNLVLKRWRDEHRWEPLEDEAFTLEPLEPGRDEIGDLVGRAVRMLPVLQREALILAEYEEMSIEQIARAVQANAGTVKSRLHRGRENLRRLLAPTSASRSTGRRISIRRRRRWRRPSGARTRKLLPIRFIASCSIGPGRSTSATASAPRRWPSAPPSA